MGAQGDAFRGDEVRQFAPPGFFHLHIAFLDEALHVPVDGAHRHTQTPGQGGLGGVRLGFNVFQNGEVGFVGEHDG